MVMVPLPEKVSAIPPTPMVSAPGREGNDPVSPAKLPDALVIVSDPVPDESSSQPAGTTRVPPSEPPEAVIVKGTDPPLANSLMGTVALKLPLALIAPVMVAVPVIA